jgi:hypothetical protein
MRERHSVRINPPDGSSAGPSLRGVLHTGRLGVWARPGHSVAPVQLACSAPASSAAAAASVVKYLVTGDTRGTKASMANPFGRLMEAIATASSADLRRQVQFLRAENQILRSRLNHRVRTTHHERARLVRLGKPLGRSLHPLISIVSPATFTRWVNRMDRPPARHRRGKRRGRPRTQEAVRQLVLRLARRRTGATPGSWGR